jgi:hypothetical protein
VLRAHLPFGELQYFLMTSASVEAGLYSCHLLPPANLWASTSFDKLRIASCVHPKAAN